MSGAESLYIGPCGPLFCFICGSSCHDQESPRFFTDSCSSVAEDLQVYLMLKHVFELPRKSFKNCFQQGSEPKAWIRFCKNCTDCYVTECVKLHQQFISVKKKFDSIKKKAVQKTKQTLNRPRISLLYKEQGLDVCDFVKCHVYAVDVPNEFNTSKILAGDKLATKMLERGGNPGEDEITPTDIFFDENDDPLALSEPSSPSSEASIECIDDDSNDICILSSDDDIQVLENEEPQIDYHWLEQGPLEEDFPPSDFPPVRPPRLIVAPAILPDDQALIPRVCIKGPEICQKVFNDHWNKCSHCGWRPAENSAWPEEELKSHVLAVHGLSQLKCQRCGECFEKFDKLKAHTFKCVKAGSFQCCLCDRRYDHAIVLNNHMMNHPD